MTKQRQRDEETLRAFVDWVWARGEEYYDFTIDDLGELVDEYLREGYEEEA